MPILPDGISTLPALPPGDVPIILGRPVGDEHARRAEDRRLHGYEVFDHALDGIAAGAGRTLDDGGSVPGPYGGGQRSSGRLSSSLAALRKRAPLRWS